MKTIFIIPMLCGSFMIHAQRLPKAVEKSFKEQFPNTEIISWKDNNSYEPLTTDVLYPDDDMDGATAITKDTAPAAADTLGLKNPEAPTEYYLFFNKNDSLWTSKFKVDGTFIIAHGKVNALPEKVSESINKVFKGKSIKVGEDIQKVIVPSSETPIYRVFVHVKKDKKHTLKVNGNGKVLSNTTN